MNNLINNFLKIYHLQYPKGWAGDYIYQTFYSNNYSDKINKKGIIFMCDGAISHGGLTDRLSGLLTTYYYAKKYNIPFYINWSSPFNLQDYLIPTTSFNWIIDPSDIIYDSNVSFPIVFYDRLEKFQHIFLKYIYIYFLSKKMPQLHVYTNYKIRKEKFHILYKELFKPSEQLRVAIETHKKQLGPNYWSFSFRFNQLLGDFKDCIGHPLPQIEKEKLIEKNILELKSILINLPKNYKVFIASDSETFLNSVNELDHRIYTIPGKIYHVDQNYGNTLNCNEIWLKTFVDQNLIMDAEKIYLLRTGEMYNSFFPRFSSLIGNKKFIYHEF